MIDPYGEEDLRRLSNFFYLIPVLGFFPALWTLYCRQGNREQQRLSRLSVTLALLWLLAYSSFITATGNDSGILTIRLLYGSALLTSGYFLTCFALMVRLWQRKSLNLPGLTALSEGIVRKNLSE